MSMMITNRSIDSNSKFQKANPSSPSDGNSSSSPNDFSGLSPSSSKMKRNLPLNDTRTLNFPNNI